LVDSDRLEIGNVSRHQAGISFAGRSKVLAARDLILEKNPRATIETFTIRADTASQEILTSLVQKTDLTINATDNRQGSYLPTHSAFERKDQLFMQALIIALTGVTFFAYGPVNRPVFIALF